SSRTWFPPETARRDCRTFDYEGHSLSRSSNYEEAGQNSVYGRHRLSLWREKWAASSPLAEQTVRARDATGAERLAATVTPDLVRVRPARRPSPPPRPARSSHGRRVPRSAALRRARLQRAQTTSPGDTAGRSGPE